MEVKDIKYQKYPTSFVPSPRSIFLFLLLLVFDLHLRAPRLRPPSACSSSSSGSRTSRVVSILGRAAGRRRPSMLVRETAALQLEERRANWAYSRPVVALDIAWNLAFSAVAVAVLGATACERPSVPLRLWITGYAE